MTYLASIIELAKRRRAEATTEARKRYKCVRSRGVFVTGCDRKTGDTVVQEAHDYRVEPLTQANVRRTVQAAADWLKVSPGDVEWFLSGAIDGADSVADLNEFCYDPMVECWEVEMNFIERHL